MDLQNEYYQITEWKQQDDTCCFHIQINKNSVVFDGHFPGNPVCPGACGMSVIRNCTEIVTHSRLSISHIRQCRFPAPAVPRQVNDLSVVLSVTDAGEEVHVDARMADQDATYITFKGTLKKIG